MKPDIKLARYVRNSTLVLWCGHLVAIGIILRKREALLALLLCVPLYCLGSIYLHMRLWVKNNTEATR